MRTSATHPADDYTHAINVIPLVDIMLVLLIIFIITLPVLTHAVRIELPGRIGTVAPMTEPITLEVEYDGRLLMNGRVVDERELEATARAAASTASPPAVRLLADRRASYDAVTRALYATRRGGLTKIEFVAQARDGL